jgi:hypothetical protein
VSATTACFGVPRFLFSGALGRIRTADPQIRSLMLYPAELRAPEDFRFTGFATAAIAPAIAARPKAATAT